MLLSGKQISLNPQVVKSLLGLLGFGVALLALFHQPWLPIEISSADTGTLVALPEPVRPIDPNPTLANQPLDVPIESAPSAESKPPLMTAEVVPAIPLPSHRLPVSSFSQHIAPILEIHCVQCHHIDSGRLDLTNPTQAIAAAARIGELTANKQMPPWKPAAGVGQFRQERRLTNQEIQSIQHWLLGGTPLGPDSESVAQRLANQAKAWQLGKPTVAYQLPQAFPIPISQTGVTWHFVIPTGVKTDLFLRAAELRPGQASLIKRMILSFDPTGTARHQDQQTPTPGFPAGESFQIPESQRLSEWSPGQRPALTHPDTGYRIPAGSDFVLTVEYLPISQSVADAWSMGLHFSRTPPKHQLGRIEITSDPPADGKPSKPELLRERAQRYQRTAVYRLPTDATLFSICPKPTSDGTGLRVSLQTPTGQNIPLLQIDDSPAAETQTYELDQPILLPKDSLIVLQTWQAHLQDKFDGPSSIKVVFEVSTSNPDHLAPLMRHNAAHQ